jgi:hypothetical protein
MAEHRHVYVIQPCCTECQAESAQLLIEHERLVKVAIPYLILQKKDAEERAERVRALVGLLFMLALAVGAFVGRYAASP